MDSVHENNIIGVRFSKVGKVYHFDASKFSDVKTGDSVLVETSRGWQLGEVAQVVERGTADAEGDLKSVSRLATPRDLLLRKLWQVRELDVVEIARKRSEELRLHNVKMVLAEYSFDGSRLTIMFSSESEDKVELKSLRQDMQKVFSPAQVEMRQIGPRDVAKVIGGMGACGLEKRCCSAFLTDFSSISIRMAKEQGISLSPTEITGMCGRLRCCLIYEYDTYAELRKGLPKRGKHIITPAGEGKVIDVSPLAGKVRVEIPEVGYREFTREELAGESPSAVTDNKVEGLDDDDSHTEETVDPAVNSENQSPEGEKKANYPQRPDGCRQQGRRRRGGRRN